MTRSPKTSAARSPGVAALPGTLPSQDVPGRSPPGHAGAGGEHQTPGEAGLPGGRPGRLDPGTEPGRGDPASMTPPRPGRTFTITLPPGLRLLSLNDRGHWAARYRRSEALKKAAWAMALQAKIPRLERVSVAAEYQPPDRRRRDSDNPVASVKAAIDGIVAAGVLPGDDSPRYVTEVTCRIGEPYPKGRLVLRLTEVPALRGNHPAGTRLPPTTPDSAA